MKFFFMILPENDENSLILCLGLRNFSLASRRTSPFEASMIGMSIESQPIRSDGRFWSRENPQGAISYSIDSQT